MDYIKKRDKLHLQNLISNILIILFFLAIEFESVNSFTNKHITSDTSADKSRQRLDVSYLNLKKCTPNLYENSIGVRW